MLAVARQTPTKGTASFLALLSPFARGKERSVTLSVLRMRMSDNWAASSYVSVVTSLVLPPIEGHCVDD